MYTTRSTNPGGPEPLVTSVNPVVFWIVSAVLALAIVTVYVLVRKDIANAQTKFGDSMLVMKKAQDTETKRSVDEASNQLTLEIAKIQQTSKALDETLTKTTSEVASVKKANDTFLNTKFPEYQAQQRVAFEGKADAKDFIETKGAVNVVETKVRYLQEDMNKIKTNMGNIDSEIKRLGNVGDEMKAEFTKAHEALKEEVLTTTKSGKATREQMLALENKTNEFQLRLMRERTQQALIALKKKDTQATLDFLNIKGNN